MQQTGSRNGLSFKGKGLLCKVFMVGKLLSKDGLVCGFFNKRSFCPNAVRLPKADALDVCGKVHVPCGNAHGNSHASSLGYPIMLSKEDN